MTVAELIEELQVLPQDRPVGVLDADGDATDVGSIVDYGPGYYIVIQSWGAGL